MTDHYRTEQIGQRTWIKDYEDSRLRQLMLFALGERQKKAWPVRVVTKSISKEQMQQLSLFDRPMVHVGNFPT